MIVFKNYFKVLKKYKFIIILYTAILLVFTIISCRSTNKVTTFSSSKPDIAIINLDQDSNVVNNLYQYLDDKTNIKKIDNDEEKIKDALFYENINAVIYIYDGYTKDYLSNNEKSLDVKYSASAYASYAKMLIEKYLKIADIANNEFTDEKDILDIINNTLAHEVNVEMKSTIDTDGLTKASSFFNFSNYTILAICIYITAVVLISFNEEKIKRRNMISSKSMNSITKELYLGNLVFVFIVWVILILLSFLIVGKPMFSKNGLLMIINSLVFMTTALSVGFLTGNLVKSQNAVNAVVNIFALGTSFVCGSFIPTEYLPDTVIKFSKILPSYWYIHNNNIIRLLEYFDIKSISPLIINMVILLGFSILFIYLATLIVKLKKR